MMGTTHAAIGALVGLVIAAQYSPEPLHAAALAGLGAVIALVPDVDHPNGTIRRKTGLLGHVAFFWLPHRGITHTLWALALVTLIGWLLLPPMIATIAAGAYASHLIADAMTPAGIYPLLPIKWRLRSPLPIRTGGKLEWLFSLGVMVGAGILWAQLY